MITKFNDYLAYGFSYFYYNFFNPSMKRKHAQFSLTIKFFNSSINIVNHGFCNGIAHRGVDAILLHQLPLLYCTLGLINTATITSLSQSISHLENKTFSSPLTDDEKSILTIKLFAQQFPKPHSIYIGSDSHPMFDLKEGKIITDIGKTLLAIGTNIFDQKKLLELLRNYKTICKEDSELGLFPLVLSAMGHALTIAYIPGEEKWVIINSIFPDDNYIRKKDRLNPKEIMDMFRDTTEDKPVVITILPYGLSQYNDLPQYKTLISKFTTMLTFPLKEIQQTELKTSLLVEASYFNQLSLVQELISKWKVDLNQRGRKEQVTPLFFAAQNNHLSLANYLLQQGAHVDAGCLYPPQSPLYSAAEAGNTEVVNLLLLHKASIEIECLDRKVTPLYIAAQNGHHKVVKLLLQKGANANHLIYNNSKDTIDLISPLVIAAQNGDIKIIKLLLEYGAKINEGRPNVNASPLLIAIRNNKREAVALLIEKGANTNKPLICSSQMFMDTSEVDKVKLTSLVKAKLYEGESEDNITISPLEMAWLLGYEDIEKLLTASPPANKHYRHGRP